MVSEPIISVVLPVYNGEKYITDCLEMIQKQVSDRLEVIVVDDGSTDNSAQLAAAYPFRLIQFKENRSLSAARNAGLEAARGKYIHFMDVDDVINDRFYEELLQAAESVQADVACAGMINEKRYYKSMLFSRRRVYTHTKDKLRATYVGRYGYVWRYLFDITLLRKHNLRFADGRHCQDLMFSLPALFYAKKLVVAPGALYTYVHNKNSIQTRRGKAHRAKLKQDWLYVSSFNNSFAQKHNFKIPGVTSDRIAFTAQKLYRKLGYRIFGKKFIDK